MLSGGIIYQIILTWQRRKMGRHKTRNFASTKQSWRLTLSNSGISGSQSEKILPSKGYLACLETFLTITTGVEGKGCATGIYWREVRDATKPPTIIQDSLPQQCIIQPKMLIIPRLRKSALNRNIPRMRETSHQTFNNIYFNNPQAYLDFTKSKLHSTYIVFHVTIK